MASPYAPPRVNETILPGQTFILEEADRTRIVLAGQIPLWVKRRPRRLAGPTSGLPPEADVSGRRSYVCLGPGTDIGQGRCHVRFQPEGRVGCDAQHYSAGTSARAPFSLIRNTRNFAGWVALAFRSA